MMEFIIFYILAFFVISSALLVVFLKRPVYSVIALIVTMFCTAGLFFQLDAYFIAIIQIIVYAGAVMVLFLFVVMLLNLDKENSSSFRTGPSRWFAFPLGIFLISEMYIIISQWPSPGKSTPAIGTIEKIGELLFTEYLLPFEIVSFLLLAAILGTTILAKRKWQ